MTLSADSPVIRELCSAYQENRNLTGWRYQIIAEDRRKYIAIDETDEGDHPPYVHRSGRFLVDRSDGVVYTIKGYGQRGHRVGIVETLTASYREGTATYPTDRKPTCHVETSHSRVARWSA